jgi:protein-L-isoaspartate(D-aspartate) O-methyltransferase
VTDDALRRYATNVTAGVTDPAVVAAFATVPRAHFVRSIVDMAGQPVPATLERIYSDEALVTRLCDGLPSSSSSQPSLMAEMLAALRLRPGMRVLEVGAGTGYNAALVATITGAPVVSVDVQADVVAEARDAVARAGVAGVTVLQGDGYLGASAHGPFDRIIATVGVGGVPPSWLDQLVPGGMILAPMEHGGLQPCVLVTGTRGGLAGQGALRSGFMLAAGQLHPGARRPPVLPLDSRPVGVPIPPVPQREYYELWFGLAARDTRVDRRIADGLVENPWPGPTTVCAVVDPTEGTVAVGPDALYPVGASEALVRHVAGLVEEWHAAGRPRVPAWRCSFGYAAGLWQPARWHLAP